LSRNRGRVGQPGTQRQDSGAAQQIVNTEGATNEGTTFSFVVPTEFVELPSQGKYYPPDHPLHAQDSIEMKQMTAKEEDMLTSRTLLKKGIALDRVMQSLIVDKRISADSLLIGDRNALIIATRCSGYGNEYTTAVTCPACDTKQDYTFDLNDAEVYNGCEFEVVEAVNNGDGTFDTALPTTQVTVTFRLLRGADERKFISLVQKDAKKKQDHLITRQLHNLIVAVNGDDSADAIKYLINNMPSRDSRHLRSVYKMATPDIDLTQTFECVNCAYEEEMEVPLNAEFFWPDR